MKTRFKFYVWFILFSLFFFNVYSNNKPVFTSSPKIYTTEFEHYNYQITALDSDNDSIIFVCLEKPEWLTFAVIDKNNANLYGNTFNYFDSVYINLSISDGIDTTFQSFYIHLSCLNETPQITTIPKTNSYVDKLYIYNIEGTDVQCQVKFNAISIPGWLTLVNNKFNGALLSGTPLINDTGVFHISLEAYRDCEICTSRYYQNFDLKIGKNNLPVVNSTPSENAVIDQIYHYNIEASDSNGDSLHFFAEKIPNWLNLLDNQNNTAVLFGTPSSYSDINDTTVVICVTDEIDTVRQSFSIKINCIPIVPMIISTPDISVKVNEEYSYTFRVSDIENENFKIYCKNIPEWLSYQEVDSKSILIHGTPSVNNLGLHEIFIVCKYELDKPCHDSVFQIYDLNVISLSGFHPNEISPDIPIEIEQCNNKLILKLRDFSGNQKYFVQLTTISGEVLLNLSNVIDNELIIETSHISSGVYIINIGKDNSHYNSYKISLTYH
jgi:hypothetical protein